MAAHGNATLCLARLATLCASAAVKYCETLGHWNHPNIHYNLALALMMLDQPEETYQHLQSAIQHGPEPLEITPILDPGRPGMAVAVRF